MITVDEKPKIRIGDDGEAVDDLLVQALSASEKRKRRPRRWWRMAPLVIALVVAGFILGLLVNPITPLIAYLPYRTAAYAARVIYSTNGDTRVVDLKTGIDDQYSATVLIDPEHPVMSPDKKLTAYWENAGDNKMELWIGASTPDAHQLGAFDVPYHKLDWSLDSTQVAFAAIDPTAGPTASFASEELFVADVKTGTVRQITHNTFQDTQPAWSPDGKQLVYSSTADGYHRLYIIDLAGGAPRLISDQCFGYIPAWSPDGKTLAFASNHEGSSIDQVYVINIDGTNLRRITNDSYPKTGVAWLP